MKKILMVCEAFGGGVFTYVSQLCNDMCDDFEIYLAYSIRPQTPENYQEFLDKRVNLIEVRQFGKKLTNIIDDIKAIRELSYSRYLYIVKTLVKYKKRCSFYALAMSIMLVMAIFEYGIVSYNMVALQAIISLTVAIIFINSSQGIE